MEWPVIQRRSADSNPRQVDAAEQADQTFREMLVAIFREYDFVSMFHILH